MSTLTARECEAGISRRALATVLQEQPPNFDGPEKIPVIDIWNRQLCFLRYESGGLQLRDTIHVNDRPATVVIPLDRYALRQLVDKAEKILGER